MNSSSTEMGSAIGARLAEEVKALGGGASGAAEHLGRAKNTLYNWFDKGNIPVNELHMLQALGVDAVYVLSGVCARAAEDGRSYSGTDTNSASSAARAHTPLST